MKKSGGLIRPLLALILLVGASVLFLHYYYWRAVRLEKASPVASISETAREKSNPGTASRDARPYVLPILGQSQRLTKNQAANMDKWRKTVFEMALQKPGEVILNGKADRLAVGLTFDDGPDGVITPQVLNVLRTNGIQATFFLTGIQMARYPEVVKEAASQGNLLLSHTYSHLQLDHLKARDMQREVERTDQLFLKLTGRLPVGVRPPYGAIGDDVVARLRAQGKVIVLWSIDTLDWSGEQPSKVAANVLDNVRPGEIVLMHSTGGRNNTLQALPLIIDGLRRKGYAMVRLDQLLDRKL